MTQASIPSHWLLDINVDSFKIPEHLNANYEECLDYIKLN